MNNKPKSPNKSYFDLSDQEKQEIVAKAAKESNQAQKKLMGTPEQSGQGQTTRNRVDKEQPPVIEWEEEFDNLVFEHDIHGPDEISMKEKGKQFIRQLLKAQRQQISRSLDKIAKGEVKE